MHKMPVFIGAIREMKPVLEFDFEEPFDNTENEQLAAFINLWASKCRLGQIPRRSDFPMDVLRPWIGQLVLMDVIDGGLDFRYRLIGTGIVTAVGRDLTGRLVSECDYEGELEKILACFRAPVREQRPVISRGRITWRPQKSFRAYENVHCPLRGEDSGIDMIIGVQNFHDAVSGI